MDISSDKFFELGHMVGANIPAEMVQPTPRQLEELEAGNQIPSAQRERNDSDIRTLGKLVIGTGVIVSTAFVGAEQFLGADTAEMGLSFGVGSLILGAAIAVTDL